MAGMEMLLAAICLNMTDCDPAMIAQSVKPPAVDDLTVIIPESDSGIVKGIGFIVYAQ